MRREVKIGLTGIVALVLLFLGIKFLKGVNLFHKSNAYYIVFDNAKGLTKSSTVYADGFNIGIVDNISFLRPGEVVVRINVNKHIQIPHGTTAHLDEAMLGGCTLNMVMGDEQGFFSPGDTLQGKDVKGLMDAAADMLPQVKVLLDHIDSLALALKDVATDPNISGTLENARVLTENLNKTANQLNELMNKDLPDITASFSSTGKNLDKLTSNLAEVDIQSTLSKVDSTLNDLHAATAKLNSKDNNAGLLLNDTALYGNVNHTVNSATLLLEDIKAHPKRYVNISVFGGRKKNQ